MIFCVVDATGITVLMFYVFFFPSFLVVCCRERTQSWDETDGNHGTNGPISMAWNKRTGGRSSSLTTSPKLPS